MKESTIELLKVGSTSNINEFIYQVNEINEAVKRRIFYVDIGNLPKTKCEQYIKEQINRHKQVLSKKSF